VVPKEERAVVLRLVELLANRIQPLKK
jgi:hypothetical protein